MEIMEMYAFCLENGFSLSLHYFWKQWGLTIHMWAHSDWKCGSTLEITLKFWPDYVFTNSKKTFDVYTEPIDMETMKHIDELLQWNSCTVTSENTMTNYFPYTIYLRY